MASTPILIVVCGLPATGKSTVAGAVARSTGFAFVRVDRIEQAIIASAELRPGARLLEVELVCSDTAAARRPVSGHPRIGAAQLAADHRP